MLRHFGWRWTKMSSPIFAVASNAAAALPQARRIAKPLQFCCRWQRRAKLTSSSCALEAPLQAPVRTQPKAQTADWKGLDSEKWWAVTGSNRRPSRCKRDALPAELTARPRAVPRANAPRKQS
jgi:hypothetical protein